jgi:hypothetical protein
VQEFVNQYPFAGIHGDEPQRLETVAADAEFTAQDLNSEFVNQYPCAGVHGSIYINDDEPQAHNHWRQWHQTWSLLHKI